MKNLKIILVIGFILTGLVKNVSAQDVYNVKSHKVVISGTSNIHDWTAEVINLSGSAKSTVTLINDVSITVDAKTLKSSKGSIMDSKMQDALNTDKYPKIYYQSLSNKILSENNAGMKISTTGNLTISGVSKTITITTTCKTLQNGNIEVAGSFDILMSNYKIEPPTALYSVLTTADKITITYNIVLQKSK